MQNSVLPLLFGFIFLGGAAPVTARHGQDAHGGAAAALPRPAPQRHAAMPRLLRTAEEVTMPPQGIEPLPVYVVEPDQLSVVALPA